MIKRYYIQASVEHVTGWQIFTIEAKSEQDALEKFKKGEGEFDSEELEVQKYGNVEVTDIEDL